PVTPLRVMPPAPGVAGNVDAGHFADIGDAVPGVKPLGLAVTLRARRGREAQQRRKQTADKASYPQPHERIRQSARSEAEASCSRGSPAGSRCGADLSSA